MGKIKRELNTNERIGNAIKIFKDITACLEDVLKEPEGAEGLPMTQVCAKHNIDYLNLRKILSLSSFQNIYTDKVITADEIELPEMDPWEKLFRAVFGINKLEPIELPVDIKESIQYTMEQCLTDREQKILNARFGLIEEFDGDPTPMTLEDVGEKMSVTRNRIRQIEAKAIRKLRHPSRAKILRDGLTKFKETEAVKLAVIEMKTAEVKKRVEEFKKQLEERRQNVDGMSELVEVLKEDKLDALNLPVRAYNALIRTRKIKTVYDVVTTPDSELVRIRNLGRRSYRIIKTSLNEYLNEFGVTLSDVRTSLGFSEDDGFLTYEETGKSIGVSGERVRQIEAKAIRQLRYPEKSKLLRDGMIKTKELEAIKEMTLKRAKEESEKRLKEYEVEVENKNYNIDGVDIPDLIIALKQRNIAELDLTVRTFNALLRHNIRTIYDLVVIEDYEFRRRIRNLGKVSQKEALEKLNQYLNKFGTTRDGIREILGVDDESDKIINHYHGDWTE